MKNENILKFTEKPYYTNDELRLYYQIAINESQNKGNIELANYYKRLLSILDE